MFICASNRSKYVNEGQLLQILQFHSRIFWRTKFAALNSRSKILAHENLLLEVWLDEILQRWGLVELKFCCDESILSQKLIMQNRTYKISTLQKFALRHVGETTCMEILPSGTGKYEGFLTLCVLYNAKNLRSL